jgi:FAD/FMN-containing dehydrogenase
MVIQYGGRVYLAKDARLSPASFREMYPNFPKWLAIKSKVDPNNYFSSALSKRLEIDSQVQQINKKGDVMPVSG